MKVQILFALLPIFLLSSVTEAARRSTGRTTSSGRSIYRKPIPRPISKTPTSNTNTSKANPTQSSVFKSSSGLDESPKVKSLLPSFSKGGTGLVRSNPQPNPLLNQNSNYGRLNVFNQPSSSLMSPGNWLQFALIYSLFSSLGDDSAKASPSDVTQKPDPKAPKFNVEKDPPGSEEINDLPDTVALSLRLLNDPVKMDAFDLHIQTYTPEKVETEIAAERANQKQKFDKLEDGKKEITEDSKTLEKQRNEIVSQLEALRAKHAKERSELSAWASLRENMRGTLEEKQNKETAALEAHKKIVSDKISKLRSIEFEKSKIEAQIELSVLKKLKPYWKTADDKNLSCPSGQTVAEFAPMINKDKIMPFGVRDKDTKVKSLGLDSYVVKACVDNRGLPSRVFAIKNLDRGEAYVSDVVFNNDDAATPSVQKIQIQKMKTNPGDGIVSEKLEERRLESSNNEKKLVYEFKLRNGQNVTLEQKIP